jgi:hypothetical protein
MDWTPIVAGVGIVAALVGVIWKQMNDKIKEHKDDCDKAIDALWDQIGRDSGSGMRVKVHNSTPMGAHVELERRVDALESGPFGER